MPTHIHPYYLSSFSLCLSLPLFKEPYIHPQMHTPMHPHPHTHPLTYPHLYAGTHTHKRTYTLSLTHLVLLTRSSFFLSQFLNGKFSINIKQTAPTLLPSSSSTLLPTSLTPLLSLSLSLSSLSLSLLSSLLLSLLPSIVWTSEHRSYQKMPKSQSGLHKVVYTKLSTKNYPM